MTDFPSELTIGLIALAIFAVAVIFMYLIRGSAKKSVGQKAKEEGLSPEVVRGGEKARPNEATFAEMEEGTIDSEVSKKDH